LRSTVVFLLSLCFYASAMVNALFAVLAASSISLDLVSLEIGVVLDIVAGSLALIYWSYHKPDYVANARPLGVSITAVESGLIGIILVVEAIILLFLPVVGILGVLVGAVGVGFFKLGKGLWDGKGWAQEIMMLLSVIGIIVSLVLLPRGEGNPILSLFQLWYLRRPHVSQFFGGEISC